MVTTQTGSRKIPERYNQQETPVKYSHLLLSTLSQVQVQEIVAAAPAERLQNPYLSTLNLATSEHLKLYKMAVFGLPKSNRYDLIRSKWTDFYQELEDAVFTSVLKTAVLIVKYSGVSHNLNEFKNVI